MFQPQPTPLSPFASSSPTGGIYGSGSDASTSISFNYPLLPDLGLDSGALFPAYNHHNPTFRPQPVPGNNVNVNNNSSSYNRLRRTSNMANLSDGDDLAAQEAAAGQYRPELTVGDLLTTPS